MAVGAVHETVRRVDQALYHHIFPAGVNDAGLLRVRIHVKGRASSSRGVGPQDFLCIISREDDGVAETDIVRTF